jgi:hypothetical protein
VHWKISGKERLFDLERTCRPSFEGGELGIEAASSRILGAKTLCRYQLQSRSSNTIVRLTCAGECLGPLIRSCRSVRSAWACFWKDCNGFEGPQRASAMAGNATYLDAKSLVMCETDNERSLKIVTKAIVMRMLSTRMLPRLNMRNFLPFDEHQIAR